jgi:hypothetical protein
VIFIVVVALVVAFAFVAVIVFIQYSMIFLMISSAQLNWQTMMTQMKEQSRQIVILFNVVSQLASSITKFKRKLIVMFSSEDSTFTNFQRVSSKRVVKFTKQAQIIRLETARIKKAKIHRESIELLFFLNFETKHFERDSASFVNKHVFFQSNRVDSIINALSISNQSFSESIVVDASNITHDLVSVSISAFVSIFETAFISAHQWLSRNVILIDNHSFAATVFNIFDTSLSSSFIDSISFFSENLLSQITTITLQKFLERARREARQQIRNVYSYDSIINQIVRSFYSDALSARSSHLLLYLLTVVQIVLQRRALSEIKSSAPLSSHSCQHSDFDLSTKRNQTETRNR